MKKYLKIKKRYILINQQKGFIAITSLLLISTITFAIAVSVSLLGIEETKSALAHKKGIETFMIGQTCIEEALIRLRDGNYNGGTLNIGKGSCTININGAEPIFSIIVNSTIIGPPSFNKKIEVTAYKAGHSISLIDWKETN